MKIYIKPEIEKVNLRLSEDIAANYENVGISEENGSKVTTYNVKSFSSGSSN